MPILASLPPGLGLRCFASESRTESPNGQEESTPPQPGLVQGWAAIEGSRTHTSLHSTWTVRKASLAPCLHGVTGKERASLKEAVPCENHTHCPQDPACSHPRRAGQHQGNGEHDTHSPALPTQNTGGRRTETVGIPLSAQAWASLSDFPQMISEQRKCSCRCRCWACWPGSAGVPARVHPGWGP